MPPNQRGKKSKTFFSTELNTTYTTGYGAGKKIIPRAEHTHIDPSYSGEVKRLKLFFCCLQKKNVRK